MTPPTPPDCVHFASHDYGDGLGSKPIFWCSDPFWSHDHSEPWVLSEYLSVMQRATVSAVAEAFWRKAIRKVYADFAAGNYEGEHPDIAAGEYRENIQKWRRWAE